jgi:ketosteroid isomerase-like protein
MALVRDIEAITETFANYVQTFQTLDPHTTLPYFHVPCLFIPPQEVRVLPTAADIEALLIQVMEGLKARGYVRSGLTDLHAHQMSENTALVSVSRARYKSDGQELERLGETYTLRRTDNGWKIAVAMIHDPDTLL